MIESEGDAGSGGGERSRESDTPRDDKFAAIENSVRIARKFSEGSTRIIGEGIQQVREGPAWTMCIDELCNAIDALLEIVKERR